MYVLFIGYGFILVSGSASNPGLLSVGISLIAVFGFLALIMNCLLCFYWSKLEIAIAVIGIAADFYADTKRLILVSLFYFLIHIAFFFLYAYTVLGLISMNTFKFTDKETPCSGNNC